MSLINDYLKKSREVKGDNPTPPAEVPPVMKQSERGNSVASKEKKVSPKTVVLLAIIILMGIGGYYFTKPVSAPIQKYHPVPAATFNNAAPPATSSVVPAPAGERYISVGTVSRLPIENRIGEKKTVSTGDGVPKTFREPKVQVSKRVHKNGLELKQKAAVGESEKKEPGSSLLRRDSADLDNKNTSSFSSKTDTNSAGVIAAKVSEVDVPGAGGTDVSGSSDLNVSSVAVPGGGVGIETTESFADRVPRSHSRDDLSHLFQVGVLALSSGNQSRAQYYFGQVLAIDPKHQEALLNMAVISLERNDFEEAKKLLGKASDNDPHDARVKVNQGLIALKRDDHKNAQKLFAAALTLDPGSKSALNNLAWLARQRGDKVAATGYYQNLVALDPQNLKALLAYASFFEQEKEFKEALSLYHRALESRFLENNRPLERRIRTRIKLLVDYVE